MFRAFIVLFVVAVLSSIGYAQPQRGDWELTLAGSGASSHDFATNQIAGDVSLGYHVAQPFLVGVRQGASYSEDRQSDSNFNGATRGFLDLEFILSQQSTIIPFIGASFGGQYGDATTDSFAAGIEAGVKWWVQPKVAFYAQAEYLWLTKQSWRDDGEFRYSAGIAIILN